MQYSVLLTTGLALVEHATATALRRQDSQELTISIVDTDNGFNVTDANDKLKIFTSYLYNECSSVQKSALKQAVKDANEIAYAGVKQLAIPDGGTVDWVDFRTEAALDYFGPASQNGDQQEKIYTTLVRSSYAFRGWGWSDWWNDKYVQLNCNEAIVPDCATGKVVASTTNSNKDFKYPLITFCHVFFDVMPSFAAAVKKLEDSKDEDRKNNVLNLRNQGSTMLHEWIHMNWGSAEVCPGGAIDNYMRIGPAGERTKAYKAGRAKLLAHRDVKAAANNNDNYVYYSLAWWMKLRYGKFPQYPSAWDPHKSVDDNLENEANQPGNPPPLQPLNGADDVVDDGNDSADGSVIDAPLYTADDYPDWYRPVVGAILPTTSPATLPVITPPPEVTTPPTDAVTTTIGDNASTTPASTPTPTPTSSGTACEGNQIQGDCVQAQLPDTGPNGGPQLPVCNKVGAGDAVRFSDRNATYAATQYCQTLIDSKVVLTAQNPWVSSVLANAAEDGGRIQFAVVFDVDACDPNTKPEDQKIDFGAMSSDDCFMNMYTNIANACAQDPTWGDFDQDFPLEGGEYGYKCAMWAMIGNKV